ncbi:CHAT domain-containing protein [Alteromonas oceani]|uniref:CHAT domain-containing protein n=1 Tax=Alteromonas oceani TaxID=2071609 RepID=A0ABV7K5H3_9ALTE|nr:CHAT domain-containing protein [Alteromonas oceani]
MHETLIEPLQSSLTADKLVIVPHGPLHYLPFAALYDGADFMLEQYSLRVLPSASVMAYLKTPQRSGQTTMLALGNPALGDPALDLPGAQNEVRALSNVVPDTVVAVRERATESLFKRYAARVPVLHIASHGEFNPEEPLSSRLLLVGDESNDGSLTVGELYDLELNSELVTLSACQTGLGDVQSGDDVIGLTRGFLFAGAANIVASLWMVDDEATARLMVNLYNNLQNQDKQQSLRNAQLSVKNNYQAHPYYWAAFQLTGSGR